MTTTTISKRTDGQNDSIGFLRWMFLRGTRVLTCAVGLSGPHMFDVCVVPHWDVSDSVVERYDRLPASLRRHAEIACYFRQAGWTLVASPEDRTIAA
jgi:hypothetical protein